LISINYIKIEFCLCSMTVLYSIPSIKCVEKKKMTERDRLREGDWSERDRLRERD